MSSESPSHDPATRSLPNVVKLDTADYAPNQATLDLLRSCEEGRVEAAFIVVRDFDGTMRSWWTQADPGALLVASTILRFDAEELLAADEHSGDEEG